MIVPWTKNEQARAFKLCAGTKRLNKRLDWPNRSSSNRYRGPPLLIILLIMQHILMLYYMSNANAQDSVGIGQYVLITGNTMDVSGAWIKGEFQAFTQFCWGLEKKTSQYRNCGTISDVNSFWRVCIGVKWTLVASVLRKRFRIFLISGHPRSAFYTISTPNFLLSGENRWYYHPTKFGMRHLIVKV
jgi:hypothetical protein